MGELLKTSEVLKEDIRDILSDRNIPWDRLRGGTALVTGATGLVGGVLVRVLSAADEKYGLNLRLIALGRNKDKGEALARDCHVAFIRGDIRRPVASAAFADGLDYVIHCAAVTKSADMAAKPVNVIATALDGTRNMLELAREKRCKSFVFLSSMEVYGQTELSEVRESDLGYLDLSNPRGSYPEAKRLCEMLCVACAAQYGLPVKIARLARTFGAGTPDDKDDTRVANQFVRKALAGEDIELHTPGNSIANCCYTADAARGLLTILLKGENGEAYNVANPAASATVRGMAELVAREICGGAIKVVVRAPEDLPRRGYAPDVGYTLNADKLKALGWSPKYGLAEMYGRMCADWRGQ
jgi:nucleoside-diphosphate-sugar epimerase